MKHEYTGKEIFSMLLPKDLNLEFKSSVYSSGFDDEMVVIKNGVLKKGVIDDDALGEGNGKLIDAMERKYGSEATRKFIDKLTRLVLDVVTKKGFSISVADTNITEKAKKKIEK